MELRNTDMIGTAEELVKAHMAKYDPSHDWFHVDRVRRTALKIGRSFGPDVDMLVVEMAALFHDMAAKYNPTETLATILDPFFSSPSASLLSSSQRTAILHIIPLVSWSTEKKMRANGSWDHAFVDACPELRAVQDADRLDAIGAFGIMRCAAFSAASNRPLFVPPGEDPALENSSAIQHFHDKLLLIRERIKTPLGREMAEQRHQTMLTFLAAVDQEFAS